MTLKEKLLGDLKRAMKEKDRSALNAIRMITNDIKNREIELRRELDDGEIAQLISAQVRKREEAIEQFRKGNRMDLVEEESRQVELLKSYLPKPLSQEELSQMIDEAIEEAGADLGKVMRLIMPKVRGRADGKLVNQMVRNKLGG